MERLECVIRDFAYAIDVCGRSSSKQRRERKMRVDKYELIREILMLCDELEASKREIAELERDVELCTSTDDSALGDADVYCLKVGRKKVFEDGVYSWREVSASRDEETGAISVTAFERFRESAFSSCPASMSRDEFFDYFDAEFRAMYEKQKKQAIEALKREEAENACE